MQTKLKAKIGRNFSKKLYVLIFDNQPYLSKIQSLEKSSVVRILMANYSSIIFSFFIKEYAFIGILNCKFENIHGSEFINFDVNEDYFSKGDN